MTHMIVDAYLNTYLGVEITNEQFNKLNDACKFIRSITTVEEIFDFVMENYYELELEMLSMAQRHLLFQIDSLEYSRVRGQINRKVMNFLSSARSYLDQTPARLSEWFGKPSQAFDALEAATNRSYDRRFGYRVLEALRNHSQHHGYPIGAVDFSAKWQTERKRPLNVYKVDPVIKVDELRNNGRFKKSVLKELLDVKGPIYFKALLREYIDELGEIHENFRGQIDERLNQSAFDLDKARLMIEEKLRKANEDCNIPMALVSFEDPNHILLENFISQDMIRFLEYLTMKNDNIKNVSTRFVNSEHS